MRKATGEFNLCPLSQTRCWGLNTAWVALPHSGCRRYSIQKRLKKKKKNSLFWSDVRPQLNRANTAGVCISQLVNTSHKMAL